tara:strand:- start:53 stop:235 length:183 start_codon:yes stop_codon:yes gene_type:complete
VRGNDLIAEWAHLALIILRMVAVDPDPQAMPATPIWYAQLPAWLRYGEELLHHNQSPKSH